MTVTLQTGPLIAFRADASRQIGTGHVMRCLTLADTLSDQGAVCHFLCRPHDGHLIERIESHGHTVHQLPLDEALVQGKRFGTDGATVPAHAGWLGVPWEVDAEQSSRVLACLRPDWLVVDHYALDARWEEAVITERASLLAIDDLADRFHRADILLDQNLGRRAEDYASLVPMDCQLLIGPQYSLLRPEFFELRTASLARREKHSKLKHLLISLGGVDKDNVTEQVLDALEFCNFPDDLEITVVMGATAPWLEQVQVNVSRLPWPTEVVVNVPDMARRMANADFSIGAAGSTSWERCCLGLPTLMVALADNQLESGRALRRAGAAAFIESVDKLRFILASEVEALLISGSLQDMSRAAASITDGLGLLRIRDLLMTR